MNQPAKIYHTGRYHYRKPRVLAAGILSLSFGLFVLRYLIVTSFHTVWSFGTYCTAIFVGAIGCALAFAGAWFLKWWFRRASNLLEISSDGISYGTTFRSWNAISRLARITEGHGVQLFYQNRDAGLLGGDRPLLVDTDLTLEEYQKLVELLQNAVKEKYPHVVFG